MSKWCKAKFLRISSNEEASTSWMLVLSTFGKQTKPGRTLDLQHIVMVTCPHQCALTGVTLFGVKQDPNCYRSRVEGPDCQEGKESERLYYAGRLLQQLSILAAEQRIKGG